jgi:outer membrane immunogenic protein
MLRQLALAAAAVAATTAVHAADLIIDEPAPVGVVDVGGNWDGPFIGIFGGYGSLVADDQTDEPVIDLAGWLVGASLGANFTLADGIVAGVVGDLAWSNIAGDDGIGYEVDVDWVGSLRARIGFDGGAFLPYLTGGLAVAGATIDETNNGTPAESNTHIGWTVGAGVEFAATENLSIDLLYRYTDYGAQTYTPAGSPLEVTLRGHQVTAGLNWSF